MLSIHFCHRMIRNKGVKRPKDFIQTPVCIIYIIGYVFKYAGGGKLYRGLNLVHTNRLKSIYKKMYLICYVHILFLVPCTSTTIIGTPNLNDSMLTNNNDQKGNSFMHTHILSFMSPILCSEYCAYDSLCRSAHGRRLTVDSTLLWISSSLGSQGTHNRNPRVPCLGYNGYRSKDCFFGRVLCW